MLRRSRSYPPRVTTLRICWQRQKPQISGATLLTWSAGPTVRIPSPPAMSSLRTCCCRAFGRSADGDRGRTARLSTVTRGFSVCGITRPRPTATRISRDGAAMEQAKETAQKLGHLASLLLHLVDPAQIGGPSHQLLAGWRLDEQG